MSTDSRVSAQAYSSDSTFSWSTTHRSIYRRAIPRSAIAMLDWLLRRALGIFEFSASPVCLLRIAIVEAKRGTRFADGRKVDPQDAVVDLHFWNEHFERLLIGKTPCARGSLIRRHLRLSLSILAEYLMVHPEIRAKIVHARVVMPLGGRFARFKSIAEMYGFEVTTSSASGMSRLHHFLEDFLVRSLIWAFNPGAPRRQLELQRADLWIERDTLIDRYVSGDGGRRQTDFS